jgi:hypothetical protein
MSNALVNLRGVATVSFWAANQWYTELLEAGFVSASVVDPFGNVLGIMYNPH